MRVFTCLIAGLLGFVSVGCQSEQPTSLASLAANEEECDCCEAPAGKSLTQLDDQHSGNVETRAGTNHQASTPQR